MLDIKRHWAAVREAAAQIPEEFTYVISLDDSTRGCVGGVVCHVSREVAGRCIVEKTHRLATKEEIAGYLKAEEERRRDYMASERRRMQMLPFAYRQDETPAPKPKKE
jgi:hypothetical protein